MRDKTRSSIIMIVILVAAATVSMAGCTRAAPQDTDELTRDQTYARLMETNVIRAGYLLYPPAVAMEPGATRPTGLFVDILDRAAELQGFRVEFVEEASFATMIDGLNNGRYDVLCGPIWANASRGKAVDFSVPLYYSALGVYVRADDDRFDEDLSRLNSPDVKFSVVEGEITTNVAKIMFPRASLERSPEGSDSEVSILNVIGRKADAMIAEPYIAREYNQKNPDSIKNVAANEPVRIFPNVMLFRKTTPFYTSTLNAAFREMLSNSEVDMLVSQYFDYPDDYFLVARPYRPAD